jgi:hypothetical protein
MIVVYLWGRRIQIAGDGSAPSRSRLGRKSTHRVHFVVPLTQRLEPGHRRKRKHEKTIDIDTTSADTLFLVPRVAVRIGAGTDTRWHLLVIGKRCRCRRAEVIAGAGPGLGSIPPGPSARAWLCFLLWLSL